MMFCQEQQKSINLKILPMSYIGKGITTLSCAHPRIWNHAHNQQNHKYGLPMCTKNKSNASRGKWENDINELNRLI